MCHKLWEPSECSKSSTWRELAAIVFALESSLTAKRWLELCMKLDLHRLAMLVVYIPA